jgi:putative FmdB family regulatory protein
VPTYEYRCKMCGHQFEAFQRMSDEPLKECPKCGKPVERMISSGMGIIFKGSGFYSTDNKKSAVNSAPPKSTPVTDTSKKPSKT